MKRLLLSLIAVIGLVASASAQSPPTMKLCYGQPCIVVDPTHPLPVTLGGAGGTVTANQGTPAAITGGWPVTDGAGADTTGAITGTGASTVTATNIDGYASAKIQITGTYAGFTVNTKVSSDAGVTFVPIQCALADGSQFGTSFVLSANQVTEIACGHLSGDDSLQLQTSAGPATGTANIDISTAAHPSMDGTSVGVQCPPSGATNSACITLGPAPDTLSVPEVLSPTSSATSALSKASTTALGTSLVVKASAGNLYGINCTGIAGAAAGYCIVYNGTAAPSTGALTGANVLDFCYFDTTARGCSINYIPIGTQYSTGIVVLLSSAASPYTWTTGTDTGGITAAYK